MELPEGKGTAQRDLIFHNGAVCTLAEAAHEKRTIPPIDETSWRRPQTPN